MTDEEFAALTQAWHAEMQARPELEDMHLYLRPGDALQLCCQLGLVLQNPFNKGSAAGVSRAVYESLCEEFARLELPHTLALARQAMAPDTSGEDKVLCGHCNGWFAASEALTHDCPGAKARRS